MEAIDDGQTVVSGLSALTPADINDSPDPLEDDFTAFTGKARDLIGMGIITIFPSDTNPKWLNPATWFPDPSDLLMKWCGKFEEAPETGILHAHIFFKFHNKKRYRFDQLCKLIVTITGKSGDIRKSKARTKNAEQCAINYVLKEESMVKGTERFIWNDSCKFDAACWDKRTKKPEKERIIEHVMSKPRHWTWDQLVHESDESRKLLCSCSWGKRFHEGRGASVERRTIKDVIIMYGAGGTGKTTLARNWDPQDGEDLEERYYKRNSDDGDFWGGGRTCYRGQRILHFEEFDGQERFANIKTWCDVGNVGPSVNIKNSGTELNHDTVIFTSNVHPAGWYHSKWTKEHKQFHPFWRRITKVWFFPANRPDGSMNIPDAETPGYYVDQTDDWKSMCGDYEMCLAHATKHWALPEELYNARDLLADVPQETGEIRAPKKRGWDGFLKYCTSGKLN
ncbi:MAG: replication associated protein [Avonheates virus SG_120]|uniref:replication associated protein n=1 Tax=Avonheates virus SG_120 TaxID=2914480 RepID=UPI002481A13C|nr:MAG: replication associated protein [Avonheates virus SG_120]UNI72623.1 MAG: replication associated protein [Avonheates virus SG_120]